MDYTKKIASHLLQIKAIKLNVKNPFTWASGLQSPIYCDNRISLSHPHVRNDIKEALTRTSSEFEAFGYIAAVATAGIPHGTLLADALGLPLIYVRNQAKKHGRRNKVEGQLLPGQKVLVVEDLISTGGSSMDAILALRDAGAHIVGLIAVFTYEMNYAKERFDKEDIIVRSLTNYSSLIQEAKDLNYIDDEDLQHLYTWREAPASWQENINK